MKPADNSFDKHRIRGDYKSEEGAGLTANSFC